MPGCDIIIPVWNQLENTRDCIESVERNTRYPYRLIIVDNASNRETAKFLEGLEGSRRRPLRVKLVRNSENQGFRKAVNKGIGLATAGYVCILNNDTVVTPGWLGEIIGVFDKDPRVGIVNPSSNTLGQGLPEGVTPEELSGEKKKDRGLFVELANAFGFCMVIKKKLFDEIGRFDEIYGMGNFEDTDFSLRAKEAGYKPVRALASYVYHKESASFKLLPRFKKDFEKNRRIFESKWGSTKRIAVVSRNTDAAAVGYLKDILKEHRDGKSWVYVISPFFETKELFENFSYLSVYHFRRLFYILAFLKILFKKKKPDLVYSDSGAFSRFLAIFGICREARSLKK